MLTTHNIQFKPEWYFWILVILARKFCLSVIAVLFRTNTIFMLSVTMLVLFMAYVVQVRYGPYMSMSQYDAVAKANKTQVFVYFHRVHCSTL